MQAAYNAHGKDSFVFTMIEEYTKDTVKERELYWFDKLSSDGIVLFNYHIATSDGGIDSKSHITRGFIFEALDDKYENNLGITEFCKKYGISNATYYVYLDEWEQLRGLVMPRSVQQAESIKKVAVFVELFKKEGRDATRKIYDLHLTHHTLRKHLPLFGLSFDDIRLDGKFLGTKDRALKAIQDYEAGAAMVDACKANDVSIQSFYKYKKLQQGQQ
jgi:ACT domain-containing protein